VGKIEDHSHGVALGFQAQVLGNGSNELFYLLHQS